MAKKLFVLLAVSTILMAPIIALSAPLNVGTAPAVTGNAISICFFANIIGKILDILWILFVAFAIIMFIVAGFLFLKAQGEPAEIATARKALLWGVIGVVVAVMAFTLPYFIKNIVIGGNNAANVCEVQEVQCVPACNAEAGSVCINGVCTGVGI